MSKRIAVIVRERQGEALRMGVGLTLADELNSVAIHNAYHLGKIVALRQRIGAWPPTAASNPELDR